MPTGCPASPAVAPLPPPTHQARNSSGLYESFGFAAPVRPALVALVLFQLIAAPMDEVCIGALLTRDGCPGSRPYS